MKKTAKVSGSSNGFRPVFSRKKRRGSILEDGSGGRNIGLSVQDNCSWSSETGDTTESESIDMKEECLVEETSFNYVVGKFSREKLLVVRNLFLKINGFGGASILLKFAGIIRAMFTSQLSLMKATKLAADAKILVNTDLKKSSGRSDQAVVLKKIPVGISTEAVCAVLSSFGVVVLIKMQLVGLWQKAVVEFSKSKQADLVAVCWSILIGKDAVCVVRTDQDKES
ncbi:hypothetical protein G9A89_000958 [Geosiphon pyriformis]|nr:hypothetical protein G9A89_000958 [Geosiphon pyriformis]